MHLIRHSLPAMIFVTCIAFFFVSYTGIWVRFFIQRAKKQPAKKLLTKPLPVLMHVLSLIGVSCFLYALLIEPYWLDVNYVTLQTDKLQDTTFRVVQFSDTHCDPKIRLEKKLPEVIQSLNPDIIVFTGDAINSPAGLENFQTMLQTMEAPLGKFAIRGNWDVGFWKDIDLFAKTGFWEMTSNKTAVEKNGESIIVAGLSFDRGPDSQEIVSQLKQDDYNLFLYHNTDLIDYFGDKPIDSYLCGHTHGGQIALPGYGALITLSRHGKKYESGLYKAGQIDLYVSRGIGMEGGQSPRVRFFARPEITVFDIGPEK